MMAFRVVNDSCQIWQMYLDKHAQKPDKLPTILPLVIYNGKISPYTQSTKLLDCFADPLLMQEVLFDRINTSVLSP